MVVLDLEQTFHEGHFKVNKIIVLKGNVDVKKTNTKLEIHA